MAHARRRPRPAELVMWAVPLLIGAASLLVSRRSHVRAWLTGDAASRAQRIRAARLDVMEGRRPFAALRDAVVGQRMGTVRAALGPPPSTAVAPGVPRSSYWRGHVWYYMLDPRSRTAIAVRFRGGVARAVEMIAAPTLPTSS